MKSPYGFVTMSKLLCAYKAKCHITDAFKLSAIQFSHFTLYMKKNRRNLHSVFEILFESLKRTCVNVFILKNWRRFIFVVF
jgi:hypothetical protein